MINDSIKLDFIKLLLDAKVLRFGEFVTKSGRVSPYFFNTGHIDSGRILSKVTAFYSELIRNLYADTVTNLFGPAYKGIPLATAVAMDYFTRFGDDLSVSYNRKEKKDHGEGGTLVGRSYEGDSRQKVVIVEDVITGGTSIRETLQMLKNKNVDVIGAVVGIDREELGSREHLSAAKEMELEYGVKVHSVVKVTEIVELLSNKEVNGRVWIDDSTLEKIQLYRKQYGSVE